jgi:hypothetical protein
MGAEYNGPTTPKRIGRRIHRGANSTKSLARDKAMDCKGFPMDCRKMLDAF